MNIYLVYKTDANHSYASRDIIGIATSHFEAVKIVQAQAKKENVKIPRGDMQFLNEKFQTQGYPGEGEFQFEKVETNKLL